MRVKVSCCNGGSSIDRIGFLSREKGLGFRVKFGWGIGIGLNRNRGFGSEIPVGAFKLRGNYCTTGLLGKGHPN